MRRLPLRRRTVRRVVVTGAAVVVMMVMVMIMIMVVAVAVAVAVLASAVHGGPQ
jgi:hypothetical protein